MSERTFDVYGLDHIQLAMPAGREAEACARLDSGVLGLAEVAKPANLAARRGVV